MVSAGILVGVADDDCEIRTACYREIAHFPKHFLGAHAVGADLGLVMTFAKSSKGWSGLMPFADGRYLAAGRVGVNERSPARLEPMPGCRWSVASHADKPVFRFQQETALGLFQVPEFSKARPAGPPAGHIAGSLDIAGPVVHPPHHGIRRAN